MPLIGLQPILISTASKKEICFPIAWAISWYLAEEKSKCASRENKTAAITYWMSAWLSPSNTSDILILETITTKRMIVSSQDKAN